MRIISNDELLFIAGGDQEGEDENFEDLDDDPFSKYDSPDGGKPPKPSRGGGKTLTQKIIEKIKEEAKDQAAQMAVEKTFELAIEGIAALGPEILDTLSKQQPTNPAQRAGRE